MKTLLPLLLAATLALPAGAADCAKGYDSTRCLQMQKSLQRRMQALYEREEQALLMQLKDQDPGFKDEMLRSVRATHKSHQAYKDAECHSSPLRDGMSLKDAGVIADQCRVDWRAARIAEVKRRLDKQGAQPAGTP